MWRRQWEQVIPFFAYPPDVRKMIYTTNAIESLHMQLRKIVKNRGHFPNDQAAKKLRFLALRNIEKNWKMPPVIWKQAANQFAILFGERFTDAMNSFYHPASHTKFRTLPPPHLCDDWVSAESTTVPERSINPFSRSRALIFENICSRKYTVQRRIVQRFFHRRIRQTEPLLQKVLVRLVCVCAYVTGSGLD